MMYRIRAYVSLQRLGFGRVLLLEMCVWHLQVTHHEPFALETLQYANPSFLSNNCCMDLKRQALVEQYIIGP